MFVQCVLESNKSYGVDTCLEHFCLLLLASHAEHLLIISFLLDLSVTLFIHSVYFVIF